ncbi:MAG: hypothetical protein AB3A66_28845 (plasmid) [Nodularia sp. CChRGM 3473]
MNWLSNQNSFLAWEARSRDTIEVKRCYIDVAGGDWIAGILLSQLIYWHLPDDQGQSRLKIERDGYRWLAKKRDDWWKECRITPKQFDTATKLLEAKNLIKTAIYKFGNSPTKHLRINWEHFLVALTQIVQTPPDTPERIKTSVASGFDEKGNFPKGENGNAEKVNFPKSEFPKKGNSQKVNFKLPKRVKLKCRKGENDLIETEITTETTSLSLNPSLTPKNSEKEREEKKAEFGFQIPQEEPNSSSRASLSEKTETSQLTNKPIMEGIVPPPPSDPFFKNRRTNPKDIAWDWLPDGPWRNEEGKLDTEFQIALANRWMKEYGGDLHVNKAKVLKHFRNDPTNLPIEWEWYQSTFVHRVVNIQTRRSHGMDTTREEQQIAKQARASVLLPQQMRVTQPQTPTEVVEQVASYALPHLQQNVVSIAPAHLSALEPPTDEFGANNPEAYSIQSATPEEIEFWANSKPNVVPISKKQPVDNQELEAAKAAIGALKIKKSQSEKSQKFTSLSQIINPPVKDEEAVLEDMRKYLNSGSDVLRQIAIDWASDPNNQCQLVKSNGRVVDIKWVDF